MNGTNFGDVSLALANLQAAVASLSGAIESKQSADVALVEAQGAAAVATQQVAEADVMADMALDALVAALAAVGVGPAGPADPPIPD